MQCVGRSAICGNARDCIETGDLPPAPADARRSSTRNATAPAGVEDPGTRTASALESPQVPQVFPPPKTARSAAQNGARLFCSMVIQLTGVNHPAGGDASPRSSCRKWQSVTLGKALAHSPPDHPAGFNLSTVCRDSRPSRTNAGGTNRSAPLGGRQAVLHRAVRTIPANAPPARRAATHGMWRAQLHTCIRFHDTIAERHRFFAAGMIEIKPRRSRQWTIAHDRV